MKCWSCGVDMVRKEDTEQRLYWSCMSCGASQVELLKPCSATGEEVIKLSDGHRIKHIKARKTGRKAKK